jgi:hypothetical protein
VAIAYDGGAFLDGRSTTFAPLGMTGERRPALSLSSQGVLSSLSSQGVLSSLSSQGVLSS